MKNRIFAIGDIHGCLDELKRMINKLENLKKPLTKKDEIVFVGDYIDRGPDSKGVIDYLIKLSKKYKIMFIKGNHEQMMEDAIVNYIFERLWISNGGIQTIQSYGIDCFEFNIDSFPKDHIEFINNTKLYYETEDYIFVHAGINQELPFEKQKDYMLWVREEFISNDTKWKRKVIFGHTVHKEPLVMDNKIGIDTGCFYYGKLTCVELPKEKFHYINRRK